MTRTDSSSPTPAELPPDPEGMNADRAQWADAAIEAFIAETGTEEEDALADLLGDLMHWCDRHDGAGSFDHALARARNYYQEETTALPTPK